MSQKEQQPSLQDFILENSHEPTGERVARFWNKGMRFELGTQGQAVLEQLKINLIEWTKNWQDLEQAKIIKEQITQLKVQAAKDFEDLEITEEIDRNDLETGYMFAIFSRTQFLKEIVDLQNPATPGYQQHAENNKQMVLFIQSGEKGLKKHAVKLSVDNLKNYANRLALGSGDGAEKGKATQELVKKIYDAKGNLEEVQKLVDAALVSEYHNLQQSNKFLVNRGPFHIYWLRSLFFKKVNTVSGRLSRSTTEDLLIDLKKSVDAAVENAKNKEEPSEDLSSSDVSSGKTG